MWYRVSKLVVQFISLVSLTAMETSVLFPIYPVFPIKHAIFLFRVALALRSSARLPSLYTLLLTMVLNNALVTPSRCSGLCYVGIAPVGFPQADQNIDTEKIFMIRRHNILLKQRDRWRFWELSVRWLPVWIRGRFLRRESDVWHRDSEAVS